MTQSQLELELKETQSFLRQHPELYKKIFNKVSIVGE